MCLIKKSSKNRFEKCNYKFYRLNSWLGRKHINFRMNVKDVNFGMKINKCVYPS